MVVLIDCLFSFNAYAQINSNDTLDITKRTFELNPIVVTGTGTHQRLKNTASPVSVITSNEIKKAGIVDFQQAMTTLVPSLSFSPNAMGSYLMMNGLSNKYVLLLVNGKKLTGDISGNVDLSRIDLSRIRRIEVLNGAASSLYGSDAIAGVINIITDDPQHVLEVRSNSRYTGKKQYSQTVGLDIARGRFGSYTSFKHDQSDGWQNSNLAYTTKNNKITGTESSIAPLAIGFHSNVIDQKFTFSANDKLSFYATGNYYWKLTDRPITDKNVTGGSDYDLHYESYRYGAGATYKLSKRNSLHFDYIGDDFTQHYKYNVKTKDYQIGQYKFTKEQTFQDAELKGIFGFTKNSTTVFGTDFRSDGLESNNGNINKNTYTISAYGQHEMKFTNNFKTILGLRYDYHEEAGAALTPKIALMYSIKNFNIRATYAGGFRAPGLDELYYKFYKNSMGGKPVITLGNTNLDPEHSNYYSLNLEYRSNFFTASITGYMNYISNMITKVATNINDLTNPDSFRQWAQKEFDLTDAQTQKLVNYQEYVNFNKAKIKGVEINISTNPIEGFSLSGNYTYAYARGQNDGIWQNIERSIRHTGTISGNYSHTWKDYSFNVNINGRLQSKVYYPSDIFGNAPGYGLWNINTRHSFNQFRHIFFEPSLGIDNIFNKKDTRPKGSNYALYSPGRMLVIGLSLRLK